MSVPARVVRLFTTLVFAAFAAACSPGDAMSFRDETITVTAQFDNANGLYVGNAVDVLGMRVGRVSAIAMKGPYVEVTMSIDENVKIPAAAQAVTVSSSVLTDRHVELTPPYREGPALRDKDRIGLDRTKTPVEFDRILGMVERLSVELQGDGEGNGPIADLIAVGAAATEGNGELLREALGRLEQALRLSADGGAHSGAAITEIVDNLAALSRAAADNDALIRDFGSGLGRLTEFLATEELGTGTTGAQLNALLEQTTTLLRDNRAGIQHTVASTETVTKAMYDYQRELSEVFDVAPLLLDNVYNAIDQQAGALRVHGLIDRMVLDGQLLKEVCNVLGLRQLGCATGTLRDFGPDLGITAILTAMAEQPR
ncbi:MlaD family protein [Nocardia sp. NPDC005366]|uniref:MlaD family protein n=1 Tax=Nocardia sp. NPDC005366 TaxID=3156878 RepID=UPI0033BD1CFD